MTWRKVIGFELEWQNHLVTSGLGLVTLLFENSEPVILKKFAPDFSAMIDVLQLHNEKTIWFEDNRKILKTNIDQPQDLEPLKQFVPPKMPTRLIGKKDADLESLI